MIKKKNDKEENIKQKIAIGYSRISTNESMQKYSLSAQKGDIEKYCDFYGYKLKKVVSEKASGTKMKKRIKLKEILKDEKFDILVFTKIDRLARNVVDLNNILSLLKENGKEVAFIENNIDTSTVNGKLFFNILGSFAEFEAGIISERVTRGLKEAKEKGKILGRPKSKNNLEADEIKKIRILRQTKRLSYSKIAKELGYANGSVIFNKLKNYKNTKTHKDSIRKKIIKIKNSFEKRRKNGLNIGRPKK